MKEPSLSAGFTMPCIKRGATVASPSQCGDTPDDSISKAGLNMKKHLQVFHFCLRNLLCIIDAFLHISLHQSQENTLIRNCW